MNQIRDRYNELASMLDRCNKYSADYRQIRSLMDTNLLIYKAILKYRSEK